MNLSYDKVEFYIGKITLMVYWPIISISKRFVHFEFPTQVIYHDKRDWAWNKSLAIRVMGFGVGIAHNHCDNPNYEQPQDKD